MWRGSVILISKMGGQFFLLDNAEILDPFSEENDNPIIILYRCTYKWNILACYAKITSFIIRDNTVNWYMFCDPKIKQNTHVNISLFEVPVWRKQ